MNKHLIVFGIVVLLICVGLSGCTENGDVIGDTSKVELVGTDFEHNRALDGTYYDYYKGTVKNIAGYMLDRVRVNVKFYDGNNNFLFSKQDTIYNLANTYTKDFSVTVYSYQSYYENIDPAEYEFDAS